MEGQPQTQDVTIEFLLDGIESGKIALADFQRDFDWSTAAVRSLLATLLMGWPAGSLLAISGSHPELITRRFEGGPPLAREVELVILDGQQRLTALLRALSTDGSAPLAVSLTAFARRRVDDIEENIVSVIAGRPQDSLPGLADPLIPLSALRSRIAFTAWRDKSFDDAQGEGDMAYELAQTYREHLHWLHDYRFPVVTLDPTVDAVSVARIFERVNRTGLRLGSFDLVVARTHSKRWNLRERWDDARVKYPLLDAFYVDDGLPILQAIALRSTADVRQAAILELDVERVLEDWEQALASVDAALRFLVTRCGVRRRDWLPYRAIPLVLGALAFDNSLDDWSAELSTWAITQSFALRYDQAVNTRVVEDYRSLSIAMNDNEWPAIPIASSAQILFSTKQRQGAIWRAFACILALNDARDVAGRAFRVASLPLSMPEDGEEAIFAPLLPRDSGERWHLRALNMVLAHPDTAASLRHNIKERGQDDMPLINLLSDDALESQLLPAALDWPRDPDELLRSRLSALSDVLQNRFGQQVQE